MKVSNKVFIETYGCTANQNDSQIMMGLLKEAGYEISDFRNAEYIIINSCGVKTATEEKIIDRLKKLSLINKKVIVAGCLTKINPERIRKNIPNFSAILDPQSIDKIVYIIDEIKKGKSGLVFFSDLPSNKPILPKFSPNKVIDILQVSEGCLSSCSFCATKISRGSLKSYRPEHIREAIKKSLKNGFKEIWLTSQDMSAYGRDIGISLPELLESIVRIKGEFYIRVGMMNPLHFKKIEIEKLVEVYKNPKIFKFLHLCVQSGSNKVLNIMRRGYTVENFIFYLEKFREEIPEITLATDIIVGHPGEDEEDFEQTVKLIKEVKPDVVNLSKFSPRPGTMASKMEQVDRIVVKKRSKKIFEVIKKISLNRNKKWIGWEGQVLVDEMTEKGFQGRNYAYKPVVVKGNFELGKTIKVKIVDCKSNYLIGELMK